MDSIPQDWKYAVLQLGKITNVLGGINQVDDILIILSWQYWFTSFSLPVFELLYSILPDTILHEISPVSIICRGTVVTPTLLA